jgi:hypothetical protein
VSRTLAVVFLSAECLASARRASAQSVEDRKVAENLFVQGSSLVNAARYAEGCPKIEGAQKLVAGIGVTLYMGECREQAGDLAAAWGEFRKAEELAASKNDPRRGVAHERAERLWPRLRKLKVVVPAADDVPGLAITDDGMPVERTAWAIERPVATQTHRIRAVAPDRESWEVVIEIHTNETMTVEVPVLEASAVASAPEPTLTFAPAPIPTPSPTLSLVPARSRPSLSPERVAGIAVFGAGLVGLTLGTVYAFDAKSKLDDSNASGHCKPNDHCDVAGMAERSSALGSATISTVGFIAGAVCLAGGAALYLHGSARDAGVALFARPEASGASVALHARW